MNCSIFRSILWIVTAGLAMRAGLQAGQEIPPQQAEVNRVLSGLLPLPEGVPRTIMNPYHAKPAWKLWAVDPSPVTLDKPHIKGTFEPPPVESRTYPILGLRKGSGELTLERLGNSPLAGFWDDVYMSLDDHHTRMGALKNQFIDAGAMRTEQDVQTLLQLGVNFTSQSYADRGRAIVDDVFNNLNTERHFFFANCVRATPAHVSYKDMDAEKVTDFYDGLFAHSLQTVGQSGSEVHALYKMMVAGACMPRTTKNLLKKHGAYAIALLTIFKAALPYADAQGHPLPFEHELRHRPAYSSHGTPSHVHYCPANAYYHGYDEQRHLQNMMDLARGLNAAPPVAVAELERFTVRTAAQTVLDRASLAQRVKCVSLTNMRFWGGPDETLEVRINLNRSYDLQGRTLEFQCRPLYPHQKHVFIREEGPGVFLIRVTHDATLPKGRIPIICTADNGLPVPSNPVFVNFYWPEENEADDHFPTGGLSAEIRRQIEAQGLKRLPATVNRRPHVDLGLVGDALRCRPGQTVSIPLKARDPEGFPVSLYRWSGEIGEIDGDLFRATIPAQDAASVYRLHFIFSDGTGGYASRQLKLLVAEEPDSLPDGWALTVLGPVESAATVVSDENTFTFGKQRLAGQVGRVEGTFVFQPIRETADLVCHGFDVSPGADLALMASSTLDDFSPRVGLGSFEGSILGVVKSNERSKPTTAYEREAGSSSKGEYLRLVCRDDLVAGYVSSDGRTWEQVLVQPMKLARPYPVGLIYRGDPWKLGVCQWLPPGDSGLPILTTDAKPAGKGGSYRVPLHVKVVSPDQAMALRYTLDGSEPTAESPLYAKPIALTEPGHREIRVKAFRDEASATTVAVYDLREQDD